METQPYTTDIATASDDSEPRSDSKHPKGLAFWLTIGCICSSLFLSALELTSISTALPTIVNSIPDFPPEQFIWTGSAYALAGAAFIPLSGSLSQILGRRLVMQLCIVFFATGSALCGAANSRNMFLAGRTIQGFGGGGILSLTNIILADLVPLRQRGLFNGLIGVTWSVAAAIGPVIGGAVAQAGAWRWLFYMNLPFCGVVLVLVTLYLKLKTPKLRFSKLLSHFDWIGIFLIISSSSSLILALTWGGVTFLWSSFRVVLPLCLGGAGMVFFLAYEFVVARQPIVPAVLLANRTSVSGYIQTFIIQAVLVSFIYYMPVYFQACKDASPTGSGVDLFGLAMTLSPISIIGGISITMFKRYRPQLWFGWGLTVVSMGLLNILDASSPRSLSIGLCVLSGAAMGTAYTGTFFPVLAPLKVDHNAYAISFGIFLRVFAQVWGITICGTVLQNELEANLPQGYLNTATDIHTLAYGFVAEVRALPQPLKDEVRTAFALSLRAVWRTLLGMSAAGLLASSLMKALPLQTETDENWGMDEAKIS